MKFGAGSNNELTQKYEKVKVQNDIGTSTHIYKRTNIPDFQLCYPWKCRARYTCSPIKCNYYNMHALIKYSLKQIVLLNHSSFNYWSFSRRVRKMLQ